MPDRTQYRFLNELARENLRSWWASLEKNRGDRARLRRAETPDDVLLMEPFFRFLQQMPEEWANPQRVLSSTMVAAAFAHVRTIDGNESFATQLAQPKQGFAKARMSELRFQQLQKSRDPEEFFRRLLRAIHLIENRVNILSLAESILHWMDEHRHGVNREPHKRIAVQWATDYYTALPK